MKFIYFGSSHFSYIVLAELYQKGFVPALIVSQPDKPKGRGLKIMATEVSQFARDKKIPLLTPESLKEKAIEHREVIKAYSKEIINILIIISSSCLIMSYTIYSFSGIYKYMILTLPIALYLVLRYIWLIYSGSIIARHPEKVFLDKKIIFGIILWIILVILIIYVKIF